MQSQRCQHMWQNQVFISIRYWVYFVKRLTIMTSPDFLFRNTSSREKSWIMQWTPIHPPPSSLVAGICCVLSLPSAMFTPGCMFSPTTNSSFPSNWHLRDSQHPRCTQDLSLAPIVRPHVQSPTIPKMSAQLWVCLSGFEIQHLIKDHAPGSHREQPYIPAVILERVVWLLLHD